MTDSAMFFSPSSHCVGGVSRRELSTWWFHLHRALSVLGLILAIAGAATGGNLTTDIYHAGTADSAHKALGGLTVAAAAIQVSDTAHLQSRCFAQKSQCRLPYAPCPIYVHLFTTSGCSMQAIPSMQCAACKYKIVQLLDSVAVFQGFMLCLFMVAMHVHVCRGSSLEALHLL